MDDTLDAPRILAFWIKADGSILQTGVLPSLPAAGASFAPDGGVVLGFDTDPHVAAQMHRYDFATQAFVELRPPSADGDVAAG